MDRRNPYGRFLEGGPDATGEGTEEEQQQLANGTNAPTVTQLALQQRLYQLRQQQLQQ